MITANVNRTIDCVKQSISDLMILTNYISQNSNEKIITLGFSLGGQINNLLSCFDKNLNAIISLFFANNLGYTVFNSPIGKYIKKDLENNNISEDELIKLWSVINPSTYKPLVPRENIFLLSGKNDLFIPISDSNLLPEKWNTHTHRIVLNSGHSGIILNKNSIRKHVIEFLKGV
jgi:esterase/lipase